MCVCVCVCVCPCIQQALLDQAEADVVRNRLGAGAAVRTRAETEDDVHLTLGRQCAGDTEGDTSQGGEQAEGDWKEQVVRGLLSDLRGVVQVLDVLLVACFM